MTKENPVHTHACAIVPMDVFGAFEPIGIDLVYASETHKENIFKKALYHPKARLSLHCDMARVVIKTARFINASYGWVLVLKDGLRTIEAQEAMLETQIVKQNPQWLCDPRMLSSPGQGGHPRGMAVDVSVLDHTGAPVDMGTVFDTMTIESARHYTQLAPHILENRQRLEQAFVQSANELGLPMLPLPSEWWDFRFPASYSNAYAPLSDADLPACLQMTRQDGRQDSQDFDGLAKSVLLSL